MAWQATYEPYGGVLAARTLHAHPPLHLGHKGLFLDNLDTRAFTALSIDAQPRLLPRTPLLYHVRNRTLLAGEPVDEDGQLRNWAGGTGRLLQPDPNGTGAAVLNVTRCHGDDLSTMLSDASVSDSTLDGVTGLPHCRASPAAYRDPLGLMVPGLLPGLITGASAFEHATGAMQHALTGWQLFAGTAELLHDYSDYLDAAVDEALDPLSDDGSFGELLGALPVQRQDSLAEPSGPAHAAFGGKGGFAKSSTGRMVRIMNYHLRGTTVRRVVGGKLVGVRFDARGFPDFSKHAKHNVPVRQTGNHKQDVAAANRAAQLSSTPSGFVWHHHPTRKRMLLIPMDIHRAFGHTGGASLSR